MLFFLLLFFALAMLVHAINTSLLRGHKLQLAGIIIPSVICIFFYNFSLSQNNTTLDWIMGQENLVSGIALIQIFEAIFVIFLTIAQIRSYYGTKFPRLWKYIAIIPSLQLIAGLIFLQTVLFIKIDGQSFTYLAIIFFVLSILCIAVLTYTIQLLIKNWSARVELKAISGIFQVLLAMFLPLIAKGQYVSFTQIRIDLNSMFITALLIITISFFGYYKFKIKNSS